MDSKIEEITACREDIAKTAEDENEIKFEGAGYHFRVSKDPHRPSYCGCSEELLTADRGAVRFYQCSKCGARISVCVKGIRVEADVEGVTAEDVAKVSKAVIAKLWDMVQEDFAALAEAVRAADGSSDKLNQLVVAEAVKQIKESWWDIAQICDNGHVINPRMEEEPRLRADFCPTCSARTIVACRNCGAHIRGQFHAPGDPLEFTRPAFCHSCGAPHPWREFLMQLKALALSAGGLDASEREDLASSFDHLVEDTSKTQKAIDILRRCLPRVGREIASGMRELLVKVATEAVKVQLGI